MDFSFWQTASWLQQAPPPTPFLLLTLSFPSSLSASLSLLRHHHQLIVLLRGSRQSKSDDVVIVVICPHPPPFPPPPSLLLIVFWEGVIFFPSASSSLVGCWVGGSGGVSMSFVAPPPRPPSFPTHLTANALSYHCQLPFPSLQLLSPLYNRLHVLPLLAVGCCVFF